MGAMGVAAGILANGAPAQAQAVKAGLLTCHASSGFGLIFGTTRDVNCAFAPSSGSAQHYVGHIDSFGFDAGYTEAGVLIWVVLEATASFGPWHSGRDL
jgi:hypothetical protein